MVAATWTSMPVTVRGKPPNMALRSHLRWCTMVGGMGHLGFLGGRVVVVVTGAEVGPPTLLHLTATTWRG